MCDGNRRSKNQKKSNKCQISHSSNVVQIMLTRGKKQHQTASLTNPSQSIKTSQNDAFTKLFAFSFNIFKLQTEKPNLCAIQFVLFSERLRCFISIFPFPKVIVMLKSLPLFFSARQLYNYKNAIEKCLISIYLKLRTFVIHKL